MCDREHNRIQVFTQDGEFIDGTMTSADGHVHQQGWHRLHHQLEDHVSIRDLQGNEIGWFGSEAATSPSSGAPRSSGLPEENLYVGEVLEASG